VLKVGKLKIYVPLEPGTKIYVALLRVDIFRNDRAISPHPKVSGFDYSYFLVNFKT